MDKRTQIDYIQLQVGDILYQPVVKTFFFKKYVIDPDGVFWFEESGHR
jgi:hypothetical protein